MKNSSYSIKHGYAIYPGSFDPFTVGHMDIVQKSVMLFQHLDILIARNSDKRRAFDAEKMAENIRHSLEIGGIDGCCSVIVYDGLIAQYAKDNHIGYIVRGLRNQTDYSYEENMAQVNNLITPLEYVYFRSDHNAISSSMVREFMKHGVDVSKYLPWEDI